MSDSRTELLVRADDAGSSLASNLGCLAACLHGIARSVEVMMPGAWVEHAATLFAAHPRIDVGIHRTLTSEWDGLKWRPLTHAPSLVDGSGSFPPLLVARRGDDRPSLLASAWRLDETLEALAPGTHVFVDHPATDTPELRATGHPGYEDVGPDRSSCLSVLTRADVIGAVGRRRIDLISYRDIAGR